MNAAENESALTIKELSNLGFTNRMGLLNPDSIEGQALKVVFRWHEHEACYLILKEQNQTRVAEYCLDWLLNIGGIQYVILTFPPPIMEGERIPSKIVLQIVDRNTLLGLSDDALLAIAATVVQEARDDAHTDYSTVNRLMGAFPTWDDTKDKIQSILHEGRV